jgi:hypothetical protein
MSFDSSYFAPFQTADWKPVENDSRAAVYETESDILVAPWTMLVPLSAREVLVLRKDFMGLDRRKLFSLCADELLDSLPPKERDSAKQSLSHFTYHHRTPLCVGGDYRDVVLAPHKLHDGLHDVIKDSDLVASNEAALRPLPQHPSGLRVWGFIPTVIVVPPRVL